MNLRRAATWITVALAILVHLAAGVAGSNAQICICSACVAIEQQDICCDPQPGTPVGTDRADDCTDCCLIPLPDNTAASISVPPSCPPAATLPEPILVATLVWPSAASQRPARVRAHPPDLLPRMLRSVILTC
ncbi:MAG: hypothetical protein L6R48_07305 [Planctomycetes bacterium]|nr:hypothetical protein [Planctomycetota bacterium]